MHQQNNDIVCQGILLPLCINKTMILCQDILFPLSIHQQNNDIVCQGILFPLSMHQPNVQLKRQIKTLKQHTSAITICPVDAQSGSKMP
jgi:hypothetical protein